MRDQEVAAPGTMTDAPALGLRLPLAALLVPLSFTHSLSRDLTNSGTCFLASCLSTSNRAANLTGDRIDKSAARFWTSFPKLEI